MESLNISQVQHCYHSNDAMIDLEFDMLLEDKELHHTEYLLLRAQFVSGNDLSQREAMRLALLERQFGDALPAVLDVAENGTETAAENGTAATSENGDFSEAIQSLDACDLGECLAHTFAPHHTPHTTPIQTPQQEAYTRQSKPDYGRAAPKPRRTRGKQILSSHERLYKEAIEAMNTLEGAHEFSLNFDIGQEGSFLQSANPAQLFQKRLNRFLREQGMPSVGFAFAFDVNKEGRLHAHGSIVFRPDQREAVITALRKTGGFIKGRSGSTQVKFVACHIDRNPTGWHKYTTVYRAKVKKLFAYEHVNSDEYCGVSTSYRRMIR